MILTIAYYLVPWGRLGAVSVFVGIPFVCVYTVLLPGLPIARRLAPRRSDALDHIASAALFGLAFFLIVAFVWTLTGLPLGVLQLLLPVGILLVVLICHFVPCRSVHTIDVPLAGMDKLLLLVFSLVLLWVLILELQNGVQIRFEADTLDHVGYVTEISDTQEAFPTTAFYLDPGSDGNDLRKGLLHVFYGLGVGYLGIGALEYLDWINAVFAVLLLLAVYSSALMLFGDRKIAVVAAVLLLIGLDEGLRSSMIRESYYSHRFGTAFFLFALMHGLRYVDNGERRELIPGALFGFAACATHVFFGLIVGFAALTVFVWKICFPQNPYRVHLRRGLWLGIALFVGIAPFGVYRYLTAFPEPNELHAEVQGVVFITRRLYIGNPYEFWLWFGPIGVLAFLTIVPAWRRRGEYAALGYVYASYLTIALIFFNPVVLPPLRDAISYLITRLTFICPFYFAAAYFLVAALTPGRTNELRGVYSRVLLVLMIIAVVHGALPLLGDNAFSARRISAEKKNSYLQFDGALSWVERSLPRGSVIATDPLTAYAVAAFTPHYVVCTFDQHAPPNDTRLAERIRDTRDILSPEVPIQRTVELLAKHHATHVILNSCLTSGLVLEYWAMDPSVYPEALRKFESQPGAFKPVYDRDGFVVFEWTGAPVTPGPYNRPFVLDDVPEGYDKIGAAAGEATLDAFAPGAEKVSRGGALDLSLIWSGSRDYPMRNYVVVIRFDHIAPGLPFGGRPFDKIARKIKERAIGRRYRFTDHHKIRSGFLSPDTWEPGDLVLDEHRVKIPLDAVPGEYRVSVKLMSKPHQPTYWVRDYFFDDDLFQGLPIRTLSIE